MKKIIEKLNHYQTTKKLLWLTLIFLFIISAISVVAGFLIRSENIFIRLIEAAHALAAVTVGFYVWKSKNENLHKYGQALPAVDLGEGVTNV